MIEQQVNIQRLTISSADKKYLDHKRCFNACISKDFKQSTLQDNQKICVKNCLHKFRDAEKFMIEKIHRTMETLIRSDTSLMASYKDQAEKNTSKQ